mmetsp:Transcript_127102/g.219925  ORF Transcript_127102/g.219925 Transcript_127102/m.219925 type:complete len:1825 (-) Transcript_127102:346-5820(-)
MAATHQQKATCASGLRQMARHVRVLLTKNGYLYRARKVSTILQLILPAFFILLMYLLSFAIKPSETVEHPSLETLSTIGKCQPWNGQTCHTLLFSPPKGTSPKVDAVLSTFLADTGLAWEDTHSLPCADNGELGCAKAVSEYIRQHPNRTQMAVSFERFEADTINYKLFSNSSFPLAELLTPYQVALDKAIFKYVTNRSDFDINVQWRGYPDLPQDFDGLSIMQQFSGVQFFYIAMMVQFVVILSNVVSEKEHNLRLGMAMMGMSQSAFWLHWLITATLINTISIIIMMLMGLICQLDLFLNVNPLVHLIVFEMFGLAMTCMALCLSTLLKTSRAANNFAFLAFALGFLILSFFSAPQSMYTWFDPEGSPIPLYLFQILIPPFNFAKCYTDIARLAIKTVDANGALVNGPGFSWADLGTFDMTITATSFFSLPFVPPATNQAILWMFINVLTFLLLMVYLDSVLPGNQGVSRPLWFPFTAEFWGCGKQPAMHAPPEEFLATLDSDVANEVRRVFSDDQMDVLRVCHMVKDYGFRTKHRAVQGVSFGIPEGSLFALLGHNGAGKTTTINMLIGLFKSTFGDAFMCGQSVNTSTGATQQLVGICPQHDILWDELTARQHLKIFGDFRAIPNIEKEIDIALDQVALSHAGNDATRTYSGGMKRRLSVAISNIGNPKIILLDEPTTGMDPHSKRQVWQLIQSLKPGRAILLTTHSMEEADTLSDKIAIMAKGQMRCFGGSQALKRKFGKGYQIKAVSEMSRSEELRQLFTTILPSAQFITNNAGSQIFHLDTDRTAELPALIRAFEEHAKQPAEQRLVCDWGVSQTTLEDVYLEINRPFEEVAGALQPGSPLLQAASKGKAGDDSQVVGKQYIAPPDKPPTSYPWRALFRKNMTFQRHQPCALACFVIFPVFIVGFVYLLQLLAKSQGREVTFIPTEQIYTPFETSSPCAFMNIVLKSSGARPFPGTRLDGPPGIGLDTRCTLPPNTGLWLYGTGLNASAAGWDPSAGGSVNAAPTGLIGDLVRTLTFGVGGAMTAGQANNGYDAGTSRFVQTAPLKVYPYFNINENITDVSRNIKQDLIALRKQVQLITRGGRSRPNTSAVDYSGLAAGGYEFKTLNTSLLEYNIRVFGKTQTSNRASGGGTSATSSLLMPTSVSNAAGDEVGIPRATIASSTLIAMLHSTVFKAQTGVNLVTEVLGMPYLPKQTSAELLERLASIFFPIIFLFPIPAFTYHIVYEKEFRLREMCKMNAMQMKHYWVVNYIFDFVLYLGIMVVFILVMLAFQLRWFMQTNMAFILLLLIGQGLCSVSVAMVLSTFTSRSLVAAVIGFLVVMGIWIAGIVVESQLWQPDQTPPLLYKIIPPFAFLHGMWRSVQACGTLACYTDFSNVDTHIVAYLWVMAPLYFLLAIYLDRVLPSKYGQRARACFCCLRCKRPDGSCHPPVEPLKTVEVDVAQSASGVLGDSDVLTEAQRVESDQYDNLNRPVVIKQLRKQYGNRHGHVAVSGLSLSMGNNTCFGLLGPNGAGKTTTISMLSGIYSCTSGTATLNGFDINTQMHQVRLSIGLCPQHDILWSKHLCCDDHLLFYARLKGVPPEAEADHVTYWLAKVGLLHKRRVLPKEMSGGEQRRLSIAIALVGSPKIVLLDEPTTGLDPTHRREIWDLVGDAKQDRCIILTTHSMEEAEVLSDNIGIMALGALRCLGSPLHLKNKYGHGFHVTISFAESQRSQAISFVKSLASSASEVGIHTKGTVTMEVDLGAEDSIAHVFEQMAANGMANGIDDWGISQTSMEDVFLNIVRLTEQGQDPNILLHDKTTEDLPTKNITNPSEVNGE